MIEVEGRYYIARFLTLDTDGLDKCIEIQFHLNYNVNLFHRIYRALNYIIRNDTPYGLTEEFEISSDKSAEILFNKITLSPEYWHIHAKNEYLQFENEDKTWCCKTTIDCSCNSLEHAISLTWFEDKSLYIHRIVCSRYPGFLRRILYGLKYIFKIEQDGGHTSETLIEGKNISKLYGILNEILL